jgi:hypothetical protein
MAVADREKFIHASFETIDSLHGAMNALASGRETDVINYASIKFHITLDKTDALDLINNFSAAQNTKLLISNIFVPTRAC